MKKLIIAGLLISLAGPTYGSDYPTKPAEKDRLCRAMAETRAIAMQPRDRVFWEDECTCASTDPVVACVDNHIATGKSVQLCGHPGSKEFKKKVADARLLVSKSNAEQTAKCEAELTAQIQQAKEIIIRARPLLRAWNECTTGPKLSAEGCRKENEELTRTCDAIKNIVLRQECYKD